MKKISLLAAVVLGLVVAAANTAVAQNTSSNSSTGQKQGKRGGQTVEQQLERMNRTLDLTDAQKPKVKAVLEETSKKRQELSSLSGQERRDKMQALMKDQDDKLKTILTKEQMDKLQKQREEMRARGKNGGEGKKKRNSQQ